MFDKEFLARLLADNKPSKKTIIPAVFSLSLFIGGHVVNAKAINTVNLSVDGVTETYQIANEDTTVGDLLKKTGAKVNEDHVLNKDLTEKLKNNDEIILNNAKNVTIKSGVDEITTKTYNNTVNEVLNEFDVDVDSDDKVSKNLDELITDNDEITHINVEREKLEETHNVKPNVVYEYSDDVLYGESVVKSEGEDAVYSDTYEVVKENGEVVSKNIVKSRQIKLGRDKVVVLGTKKIETREIDFETNRVNDDSLYEGEEKLARAGEKGILEIVSKVDESGKEEVISTEVTKDPVNRIIKVGTKVREVEDQVVQNQVETIPAESNDQTYSEAYRETVNEIEDTETETYDYEEVAVEEAENTAPQVSNSGVGQQIVNTARQYVGYPYVWGGTNLTGGIDCSGFTMRIYGMYGVGLPHQSNAQLPYGEWVAYEDRQPGDLLLFGSAGNIYHVGIANEYGGMIHASNPRDGIKEGPIWNRPYAVKRIFN